MSVDEDALRKQARERVQKRDADVDREIGRMRGGT